MENFELNDIANQMLIINKITFERLLKQNNFCDCIALYMFYYYTAKWQSTNIIKATDEYVSKCLKWGNIKIKNTKETLKKLGLIEIVQRRSNNKIIGWFLKINFISNENHEKMIVQNVNIKGNKLLELLKPTSSLQDTNAYILYNKMLYTNNINITKDKALIKDNNNTIINNSNENKKNINIIYIAHLKNGKECECINSTNKLKCSKKATWLIDGKYYCHQHSKKEFKELKEIEVTSKFTKPTIEEIKNYCNERKNKIDAEYFFDYYESIGWHDTNGKPMKNWKHKILSWEKNQNKYIDDYFGQIQRTKKSIDELYPLAT